MIVKIAEDSEILIYGPNVMLGYYNKPKETAEAIDAEGWLHTGDIGEMNENGFLKITGRKKDILVLANGKKVAPQPIESRPQESTYISQIVLLGDNQSTVTALVVLAFARVKDWAKERSISVNFEDNSELTQHPEVVRLMRDEIQQFSGDLADLEKIHRFSLMDHQFTEERGEVTPNLKIKRRVVLEKYKDVIEAMYR